MRIQLISKREANMTGTSRYTSNLFQGFQQSGLDVSLTFPDQVTIPAAIQSRLKKIRLDPEAFFSSYPLRASLNGADIYHLTSQMLATLLLFQRFPKRVIVTVLDIIPFLVRHQPDLNTFRHPADKLFYRLALAGLSRADALIAISNFTRKTLIELLNLSEDRIHVIYPGVDLTKFHPMMVPAPFRAKYGLMPKDRYVLYIGSEDPRKNLTTLIRAFALVKQHEPGMKLLKVGAAQYTQERRKLQDLITTLNLQNDILFLNYVPDDDLPLFYSGAEALVMPSLYEGFGLPVVEAMACGTPVVCTRGGSLPEVIGEAGIQVETDDVQLMAESILTLIHSPGERTRLRQAGCHQAANFSLQRAVCGTREVYAKIVGDSSWHSSPSEY